MRPLTDKVGNALIDADYPADKQALLDYAERTGSDPDVLSALRGLPPVEYGSRDEVLRSIDADPGDLAGQTATEQGRQAMGQAESPLAEHLRETDPTPVEDEVGYNARS